MLFSFDELEDKDNVNKTDSQSIVQYLANNDYLFISSNEMKHLDKSIGTLQEGMVIPFTTKRAFTMVHLIEYCLKNYCPRAVFYGATWGLSQKAAECLVKFKDLGLLTEINFLFDHRIQTMKPQQLEYVKYNAKSCGFTKSHAKIAALYNEEIGVSIVSSMNYTDNPRFEAGTLIVSKQSAMFFAKQIEKEILSCTAQHNSAKLKN